MATISQKSFAGGELAPALYARTDTIKYQTGARTIRNFFIMRHGGLANRPGTEFIMEVLDSELPVKLMPFEFNADQTYALELGEEYMRVIRLGAQQTETAKAITAATQANPCVLTITGHGYSDDEEVYLTGIGGMTALNGRNFKVAGATANTFSLKYMDGTAVDSSAFSAYTSGGTAARVYTLETPYAADDLPELQYIQSADVITQVHPSYPPQELSRLGHTNWTLDEISFAPGIDSPTGVAVSGSAGTAAEWVVTALSEVTYEESLPSAAVGADSAPTNGAPRTISWSLVVSVDPDFETRQYNVYRKKNGIYGFIGTTGDGQFVDNGIEPDVTETPPTARNPFFGTGNYPSAVTYCQQRLTFANTDSKPESVWMSRSGHFKNFTVSSPLQDDDAVTFTMAGRKVNEVRHLLELGKLLVLTTGGEHAINGDEAGIIKPGDINPKQQTANGSSTLPPLVVGDTALYVQARGSIVRDLGFQVSKDGYTGDDLTIFSAHLFDGHTLVDWAYQQTPHSVIWAVRSDGVLLGLTYVREHQVWGWHRHDFDGFVENVCVVPEGNEDALYLVIRRTINGVEKRYIERMHRRRVDDIVDSVFLDCSLSYDGRNDDDSHTMTLSGGTTWVYSQTLTLTSSTSFFSASDVGNAIYLTGADGSIIRFKINGYTSPTQVTGKPHKTVPVSIRSIAISSWTRAVNRLSGLWHLEGKSVSVFADGFVVANPNNEEYAEVVVENGAIELGHPYGVIHVGLPITSDLETLDIDTPEGNSLATKKKLVTEVAVHVEKSRGGWIGAQAPADDETDAHEGLNELSSRSDESPDDPNNLKTDKVKVQIRPEWNSNGRIFIRQTDPLPLTILAVIPTGTVST